MHNYYGDTTFSRICYFHIFRSINNFVVVVSSLYVIFFGLKCMVSLKVLCHSMLFLRVKGLRNWSNDEFLPFRLFILL